MARTSTPLSCLILHCLYFAAAFAEQKCSDSTAAASWAASDSEQGEGLELLQFRSKKVKKLREDQWQCHNYEEGQSDDWCASVGMWEGNEYRFNNGVDGECGDCWCCKRTAQDSMQDEGQMLDEDGPEWQCHTFEAEQDNDWCIERSSDKAGEYEFSWTGGKAELPGCGDCWCCKRNAAWRWESKSDDWMCHKYAAEESDDWCASAGTQNGYEFAFNGGVSSPCGDCWCCKREVEGTPQLSHGGHELQEKHSSWQCHHYDEDSEQNDDWCMSAGTQGGYEYAFQNGECGDCWCCKRSAPGQEIVPASQAVVENTVENAWQCFSYNEEQDNDWCIGMTNKNMKEFEFAYTGGKVDLCGDCWCCRRSKMDNMGLAQIESSHSSKVKTVAHRALTTKADREDEWQCHNYVGEQSDDWCKNVGSMGGFQYEFNGGNSDQCGDCWCCKRSVSDREPAKSTAMVEQPWQCHAYDEEKEESDEWCISMANKDSRSEYEFAYTGGQVDLCGDCWCCKRSTGHHVESRSTKHRQLEHRSKVASLKEDSWTCHNYVDDQDDDWCQMAGIHEGFEYAFNGGSPGPCGDCWCCKREIEETSGLKELTPWTWQCHHYAEHSNQDDDWCASTKEFGGFELAYTGGTSDLCGDCWCCKRQLG